MVKALEFTKLGLDQEFPDDVFVLSHPSSGKYGCFCHDGVHGLACFSSAKGAVEFASLIDLSGMRTEELTFDEARDVAKSRPLPVVAVMLLDSVDEPVIHYIR